jgi:predicted aminopeptidase
VSTLPPSPECSAAGRLRRAGAVALLLAAALAAGGCASTGYYAQAVRGHLSLLAAARPIDAWLADPATPAALRERLAIARQMRAFAARELGLPDNRSYTAYADLARPAAVWNVFAAPELSLRLKTWCYPFAGCAAYRGYFDLAAAQRTAGELKAQGYDVNLAPVPAYSTLGWTDWLGGDPLLNTFIDWPEADLARLIFHELAHQVLFVRDDTVFNESFATAVEREGVRRWIAQRGDPGLAETFAQSQRRRADFLALLLAHRSRLAEVYASGADAEVQRAGKRAVFADLQSAYRRLRQDSWGGFAGYDRFFERELNNAHLGAVGAYNDLVPAFEALLAREGNDLPRFYATVRRLAQWPKAQRDAALRQALVAAGQATP